MGLTMDDIRKLEDETQKILQRKLGRLVPEDEEKEVEFILKEEEDVTEVSRGFNVRGAESLGGALHKRNSKKLVYVLYSKSHSSDLSSFFLSLYVSCTSWILPSSSLCIFLGIYTPQILPSSSSLCIFIGIYTCTSWILPSSSSLCMFLMYLPDPPLFFLFMYISWYIYLLLLDPPLFLSLSIFLGVYTSQILPSSSSLCMFLVYLPDPPLFFLFMYISWYIYLLDPPLFLSLCIFLGIYTSQFLLSFSLYFLIYMPPLS